MSHTPTSQPCRTCRHYVLRRNIGYCESLVSFVAPCWTGCVRHEPISPDPRQVPTGRADPDPASIPFRALVDTAGEGRQGRLLDIREENPNMYPPRG